MSTINLYGNLLGYNLNPKTRKKVGAVIHIVKDQKSLNYPAENAYVYVELGRNSRARYISWINIYDIEHADRIQKGAWRVVERSGSFSGEVEWIPYGWGDSRFPSVADV